MLVYGTLARPAPPPDTTGIGVGSAAPAIVGTTLDGIRLDLADYRGRPVIVNFWGPSCVPCRDEFPLFKAKLAQYGAEGLAIIGVLMYDGPDEARRFVTDLGADWPTVVDPDGALRTAYRAIARPQSYFIDRDGVVRAIAVGQVTEAAFDADWAKIGGAAGSVPLATAPARLHPA